MHEHSSHEVEVKSPLNETFLLVIAIIVIMFCINRIWPYDYWSIAELIYNN